MRKYPKHPWYRRRGYIHFDPPASFRKAYKVATSPDRVARHAFYPLIAFEAIKKKIRKDAATGKLIPEEKPRGIAYASHMDSHIYSYYAMKIGELYEQEVIKKGLGESVLAFRAIGKSNIDIAHEAFEEIMRRGECAAVALDVSKFFDRLDHGLLKIRWASLLGETQLPEDHYNIYRSLTKFAKVDKEKLYKEFDISKHNPRHDRVRVCSVDDYRKIVRGKGLIEVNANSFGIPQGSPMSALLSNIYMLNFDEWAISLAASVGGRYLRYCDDMLFIVPVEAHKKIAGQVRVEINQLKLDINVKKTDISVFSFNGGKLVSNKPLQYLGFIYDGEKVLIRSAALARYSERMRRGVNLAKLTKKKCDAERVNNGRSPEPLYKRKIYERYSHFGKRNFVRYGLRAAETMESKAIKKQLKPLWKRLLKEIEK